MAKPLSGKNLFLHRILRVLKRFPAGRGYFKFVSVLHGQIKETDFFHILQAHGTGTADHGETTGWADTDIADIRLNNAPVGTVYVETQIGTEIQEGGHRGLFGSVHKTNADCLFIHRPGVHDVFFLQIEGLCERTEFKPFDLAIFDGKQLVAHG